LSTPQYVPSNCAFAVLQRKAGGPQAGQLEDTNVRLDVHSLAQLQRDSVPATDDSPKYAYTLGQHGQYGKWPGPICRTSSAWGCWNSSQDCFYCLASCMQNMCFVVQTCPPCWRIFSLAWHLTSK